jgi:hypothetical protein
MYKKLQGRPPFRSPMLQYACLTSFLSLIVFIATALPFYLGQPSSYKMQLSALAVAARLSCFYILSLYLGDVYIRWRYTFRSWPYYVFRLLLALLFCAADIALCVISNETLIAQYVLQGLSLLLNFVVQVRIILA